MKISAKFVANNAPKRHEMIAFEEFIAQSEKRKIPGKNHKRGKKTVAEIVGDKHGVSARTIQNWVAKVRRYNNFTAEEKQLNQRKEAELRQMGHLDQVRSLARLAAANYPAEPDLCETREELVNCDRDMKKMCGLIHASQYCECLLQHLGQNGEVVKNAILSSLFEERGEDDFRTFGEVTQKLWCDLHCILDYANGNLLPGTCEWCSKVS